MADNSFGNIFKITCFGESHGSIIGVVMDGVPPGLVINTNFIQSELDRRRPGKSNLSSSRSELDKFEIVSGIIRHRPAADKEYDNVVEVFPKKTKADLYHNDSAYGEFPGFVS
ncbi:MAG: chorismate synthase, partial [Candidatus Hermodarchaeota archaeon]